MNILHISANYPPLLGGPAASVPYLAMEQAKKGHNVFVLTHGLPEITAGRVTVHRCGEIKGDITSIKASLKKSVKMGLLGKKIIKKNNIDMIHAHDPNVSAIACIIANPFRKIPSVVKYSGDFAWEFLGLKKGVSGDEKDFWNSLPARTVVGAEKFVLGRFHSIVVQNEYQEQMLKNICKIKSDKIIRIPNGVHVYRYSEKEINKAKAELPEGLKIASVCRLVPWKGLEYGIRAIKSMYPEATYIIFGEGPDKHRLKEITKREGMGDNVIFFGKIPHEKVQLYLSNCDILLVPSVYEPFGIGILDGFAAGIPVVGSRIGGIPELIDNQQLFDSGNLEDMVNKINLAIQNKNRIVAEQRKKLDKYQWQRIAENLQKEYELIMRRHPVRHRFSPPPP
jgi:1,4-alpha-glucan branching enzyme